MRRVVVFDLDDTLFPEWQYIFSGFRAVDRWLVQNRQRAGFFDHAKALFDAGARGNIFDRALKELGLRAEKSLIDELVRVYREHPPALTLYDDARWAISFFRARGPLGLLTDGYLVAQQNKFAALNIAEAFQSVVFSDALGRDCWKPSPVPYRKIMSDIPGAPADYVYIADNPKKDFIGARALGWQTIQIARPEGIYFHEKGPSEYLPDQVISTLRDLESL
jgi:putative hydrolase of the HAD superfamily